MAWKILKHKPDSTVGFPLVEVGIRDTTEEKDALAHTWRSQGWIVCCETLPDHLADMWRRSAAILPTQAEVRP